MGTLIAAPTSDRLIVDTFPLQVIKTESVVSERSGSKNPILRVTGVFQEGDSRNQNGRIYPTSVLKTAVDNMQEGIKKRSILGEWMHPDTAVIHLDRISHVITKLWMEGKRVYGVAEVLEEMPCGKQLAALLRAKVQIGISSRGVGDMEIVNEGQEDEVHRVKDGYALVTFDVVAEPSISAAILSVMEGKDPKLNTRSRRNPKDELAIEIEKWLKSKR